MCYKIRNVNDLNVKTQTTKWALFVNYIIVAFRRTASMAHAQYGHHFAVTTAPVYVRYVEPNYSSTHSIQENITTIRMRNKQMERTEIAYGWEKKKNCNVCLTVFLCLNEANENKGEAACRILNSSHCESCYSMYTNRIFFYFLGYLYTWLHQQKRQNIDNIEYNAKKELSWWFKCPIELLILFTTFER